MTLSLPDLPDGEWNVSQPIRRGGGTQWHADPVGCAVWAGAGGLGE